jgi:hypothetical protein
MLVDSLNDAQGQLPRADFLCLMKQYTKFITSQPSYAVRLAHACDKQTRDLDEGLVSGGVPEGVVDRLQAINIREYHCRWDAKLLNAVDESLQFDEQASSVRQTY